MCRTSVLLACLACSCHGRRVQHTAERTRESSQKAQLGPGPKAAAAAPAEPAEASAAFILASEPATAWQVAVAGHNRDRHLAKGIAKTSGNAPTHVAGPAQSVSVRRNDVFARARATTKSNAPMQTWGAASKEDVPKAKVSAQSWAIDEESDEWDEWDELDELDEDDDDLVLEERGPDDPVPVGFGGVDGGLAKADEWFEKVEARRPSDDGRPMWVREKRNRLLLKWADFMKEKGDVRAPKGPPVAGLRNVSLALNDVGILRSCEWQICQGQVVGLVGESGCGKSTQLRLLASEISPDAGEVWFSSEVEDEQHGEEKAGWTRPAVVHVHQTILASLSVEERSLNEYVRDALAADGCDLVTSTKAVWQWVGWRPSEEETADDEAAEERGRSWFGPGALSRPVRELSSGQQLRLAISVALARRPRLFLVDEPTNHLDVFGLLWLETALKHAVQSGVVEAVAAVSHDRAFLEGACNHIVDASGGGSNLYTGSYTIYLKVKAARAETLELRTADDGAVVQPPADRKKTPSRFRFYLTGEEEEQAMLALHAANVRAGGHSAQRTTEDTSGEASLPPVLLHGVDLEVRCGERLLLVGPNGIGKSSLLRALAGDASSMAGGQRTVDKDVDIFVFDQDAAERLSGPATAFEWLCSVQDDAKAGESVDEIRILRVMKQLGIPASVQQTPLDGLSGGEKSRMVIAQMLLSAKNLLILDEPTNHLDLHARAYLQEAIQNFDGGIILASHDRHFAAAVATRVLALDPSSVGEDGRPQVSLSAVPSFAAYLADRPTEKAAFEVRADPTRKNLDADLVSPRRSIEEESSADMILRDLYDETETVQRNTARASATPTRLSNRKPTRQWGAQKQQQQQQQSSVQDENEVETDKLDTSHSEQVLEVKDWIVKQVEAGVPSFEAAEAAFAEKYDEIEAPENLAEVHAAAEKAAAENAAAEKAAAEKAVEEQAAADKVAAEKLAEEQAAKEKAAADDAAAERAAAEKAAEEQVAAEQAAAEKEAAAHKGVAEELAEEQAISLATPSETDNSEESAELQRSNAQNEQGDDEVDEFAVASNRHAVNDMPSSSEPHAGEVFADEGSRFGPPPKSLRQAATNSHGSRSDVEVADEFADDYDDDYEDDFDEFDDFEEDDDAWPTIDDEGDDVENDGRLASRHKQLPSFDDEEDDAWPSVDDEDDYEAAQHAGSRTQSSKQVLETPIYVKKEGIADRVARKMGAPFEQPKPVSMNPTPSSAFTDLGVASRVAGHLKKVSTNLEQQPTSAAMDLKGKKKKHPHAKAIAKKQVIKKRKREGTHRETERKTGYWNKIKKYKIKKNDDFVDDKGDRWTYR